MLQMKEQDKTPEEQLSEVEIGNLPEKELRIMIVKMCKFSEKEWRPRPKRCKQYFKKS